MIAIALIATLLAGAPLPALTDDATGRIPVTVLIYDGFGVNVEAMTAARAQADAIFREAGIAPVWLLCGFIEGQWQGESDRCRPGGQDVVMVRLLRSSRLSESKRVRLGEAQVDTQAHMGLIATVFVDRVVNTSSRAGTDAPGVLGRVIAHEIGHLLIGSSRHPKNGLMRAVWTDVELRHSVGLEWQFSASEARSMRAEIARRSERTGEPGLE